MRFRCIVSVEGTAKNKSPQLIAGQIYHGNCAILRNGRRIMVYSEHKEWMTFDPKVFIPA